MSLRVTARHIGRHYHNSPTTVVSNKPLERQIGRRFAPTTAAVSVVVRQRYVHSSPSTTPPHRCYYGGTTAPRRCTPHFCHSPCSHASLCEKHDTRFFSSSPPHHVDDVDGSTTTIATTPLSELSETDISLAVAAAENDLQQERSSPAEQQIPPPTQPLSDIPGVVSGGKKLAVVYTCKVCDTRSAKRFSENAYRNGLVMVRCPGCENLHLIADRLGVFEDTDEGGWDIERYIKKMGEKVVSVTDDNVLELTLRDVMGDKMVGTGVEVK